MVTLLFREDISKNKELIEQTILDGGVIIYPTDTVYGIGGRADSDEVINKIYELKQREFSKPMSVIVPDFDFIENQFNTNEYIKKKMHSYFPGKYTLLLEPISEKNIVSKDAYKGKEKIGIRICNHFIQDIVYELQLPIVSTSCNISGESTPKSFEQIPSELMKKVDLVLIDDESTSKKASTIINFLENNKEEIIR